MSTMQHFGGLAAKKYPKASVEPPENTTDVLIIAIADHGGPEMTDHYPNPNPDERSVGRFGLRAILLQRPLKHVVS